MKKMLCLCLCTLLSVGSIACSSGQKDERADREIVLSEKAPSSVYEEPEEPSEASYYTFDELNRQEELSALIKNNPQLYRRMLDKILKIYYTGILTGRINADQYKARHCQDELPAKNASAEERRRLAEYCTVGGALEYFGCEQQDYTYYYRIFYGCLHYFCYDREGNIFYYEKDAHNSLLRLNVIDQTLYFIFKYANPDRLEREAAVYAAAEIDTFVKNYYNGIMDGTITDRAQLAHTADRLPPKGASVKERKAYACNATLAGAIDYAGYYSVYAPYLKGIGYNCRTGTFCRADHTSPDILVISSPSFKLSELPDFID